MQCQAKHGNCFSGGLKIPEGSSLPTEQVWMMKILRMLPGVFLVAALVWYLTQHPDELQKLQGLALPLLLGVAMLRGAAYISSMVTTWWLLRRHAPSLRLREYLSLAVSGYALTSMVMPGSGYAMKTLYLKQRHGLTHSDFFSISLVVLLLAISMSGLLALVGIGLAPLAWSATSLMLTLLALGMLLGPWLLLYQFKRLEGLPFIAKTRLSQVSFSAILDDVARFRIAVLGQLLRVMLSFAGFGLLFEAMLSESLFVGGLIDSFSMLLRLVHVIPGNIGLYEWTVGVLTAGLGFTISAGLLVAAAYRVISMLAILCSSAILRLLMGKVRMMEA
jgi:hypothetical protein